MKTIFKPFAVAALSALAITAGGVFGVSDARAQTAGEATSDQATSDRAAAIERTIRDQVDAMRRDDWALAFTYASPTIQGMFQTPQNFSRMVTNGYPMVWRPKSVQRGKLEATPDGLVQTMLFEDQQGRLFVADYFMQEIDGVWRINGVQIRPAPEQTV